MIVTDRTRNPGSYDIEVNGRLLGQATFLFKAFVDALVAARAVGCRTERGVGGAKGIFAVHVAEREHELAEDRVARRVECGGQPRRHSRATRGRGRRRLVGFGQRRLLPLPPYGADRPAEDP